MDQELRRAAKDLLIRYGGDSFPNLFHAAQGAVVVDDEGREILDFTSGQMCATVGHNHPAIVRAIKESCDTAIHMFSGMIPETVAKLARKLGEWLPPPLKRSLFVNTGSEANEAALRIAKLATGGYEVIALGGSWHGTTGASAAASYASDRRGYGPKVPGGHVIPEPNAYRCPVEHCRDKCDMTCLRIGLSMFDMATDGAPAAAIAEPVISAGGVIVPPDGYFQELRKACDARGMLLIFDEAQTAFGRIGDRFAATKLGVIPDVMSVSKTLGGGVPLAATITSDAIEEKAHKAGFTYYTSHVSDPLPAAVGLAVLETIEREDLIPRAVEMGAYLRTGLETLQQRYEAIGDVRGEGLLLGVELVQDRETRTPHHALGAVTTARCFELGLSMNIRRRPERGSVWRIAPPLTVTAGEIDRAVDILDRALKDGLDTVARG
ncbi:MAG: aminotransferase class III-fold pyridoxal phosphate-dependent enzyme [Alphaproteobacteria bacterium]|nr:aminotransferase class III-fold pyridoxal phosphate-dependent enzyme [Alphaproteobacteria bacterium]